MRRFFALFLVTTGCVTRFDFVPVAQPELARAGHDLVDHDHVTVHTARGDATADSNSSFEVVDANGVTTGPWPLRTTALDCASKADCKLTQKGDFKIRKPYQHVDGDKVTSYIVGTVVVAALSGLVAEHVVCFSDPSCQDAARTGLVVTDVVLGVTALALVGAGLFLAAMWKGMNN